MKALVKLIEQQNEFETFKTEKVKRLEEHVAHLKYLITTELLSNFSDFEHKIKDENILLFIYKELTISIQIINPVTEKRNEKEYNIAQRIIERLKIEVNIQRKMNAQIERFIIYDVTKYKTQGAYTYQTNNLVTENFLEILDNCFDHVYDLKIEFINKI